MKLGLAARPLSLGFRRRLGAVGASPSVSSAIMQVAADARAIVSRMPRQQTYPPAFAKYFWLVTAATYGVVVQLLLRVHKVGENEDFGDQISALITRLNDKWDALGQGYRKRIFAAMAAGAPSIDLGNDGLRQNLLMRLDLLDQVARELALVKLVWPQSGESSLYNFLDRTNRFLRGTGESAVRMMESLAKIPGRVGGAALSGLPWGWIALGFAAFVGGRYLLRTTGPGGRLDPVAAAG